jgi:hypothetical protein
VSDRRILAVIAVKVNAQLIAPDERYTVVVDFTGTSGKWVLSNDAATPYPAGDPTVATVSQLMHFRRQRHPRRERLLRDPGDDHGNQQRSATCRHPEDCQATDGPGR